VAGWSDLEVGGFCYFLVVVDEFYFAAVAAAGWTGLLVCLSLPEAQYIGHRAIGWTIFGRFFSL
jgi:hypothetical protein